MSAENDKTIISDGEANKLHHQLDACLQTNIALETLARSQEQRIATLTQQLAEAEAKAARLEGALRNLQPFVEEEHACREHSYLPEPLDEAEEFYLTAAQDAVETIRQALAPPAPDAATTKEPA